MQFYDDAVEMNQVVSVEDSIYTLSQPLYPPIPAHELYGAMLLEMNRPALAREQFAETLRRTPGRPMACTVSRVAPRLRETTRPRRTSMPISCEPGWMLTRTGPK
jgi:hypothetical protein